MVQESFYARLGKAPCSGVQGLLLTPNDCLGVRVSVEILLQQLPRERIQLFDAGNSCLLVALGSAVFVKRCVNLTSAKNDAVDFVWFGDGLAMLRVWDDPLELRVASELLNTRSSEGMTKQGFGEEDNES